MQPIAISMIEMHMDESHSLRDVSPMSEERAAALESHTDQDDPADKSASSHHNPVLANSKPPSASWSSLFTRAVTNSWGFEFLCWLLAAVSLVVIIIILAIFNGAPLANWHSGITINTLVNVLSTVGQTAILVPVAESISQLKWLWYRRSRAIGDMEAFDDASRGPISSFCLVFKRPKMFLVYLGVINTTLIVLFGAFAQAAVQTSIRQIQAGSGTIARSDAWQIAKPPQGQATASGASVGQLQFISIPTTMQLAITQGLQTIDITPSNFSAACQTGNCTFGLYTTMGVCPTVDDMTPTLIKNCPYGRQDTRSGCSYTVPDLESHQTFQQDNFTEFDLLYVGSSQVFAGGYQFLNPNTLVEFYIIYLSDPSVLDLDSKANYTAALVALRATLDLCIITYNTTVINGTTNNMQTSIASNLNWQTVPKVINNIQYQVITTTGPNNEEFYITQEQRFAFNDYLSSITFTGNVPISDDTDVPTGSTDGAEAMYTSVANGAGIQGLQKQLTNLASSMTNAFRTTSDVSLSSLGTATAPQVFITVDFRWLIVPIASIAFALIFLLAVMVESRRRKVPAWKSSQTAALLCLGEGARKAVGGLDMAKEMEERVGAVGVRLEKEGEGWVLEKVDSGGGGKGRR